MIHVVIPGWNLSDLTIRCLHAVAKSAAPVRVCYVDNGSEPEQFEAIQTALQALPIESQIICNDKNEGFTRAIQQGIDCRENNHVLVLNNDCRVESDCIERMLSLIGERVASVCPLTNDHGACSLRKPQNANLKRPRQLRVLPWFCCLLNREALGIVNQLPTAEQMSAGLGVDDWWSLQLAKKGWKHLICNTAFAVHDHKATFRAAGIDRRSLQKHAIQWLRGNQNDTKNESCARPNCCRSNQPPVRE